MLNQDFLQEQSVMPFSGSIQSKPLATPEQWQLTYIFLRFHAFAPDVPACTNEMLCVHAF